jgi:hypothetical protein
MEVENNTQAFFLPGESVTDEKLHFNPASLYQNRNSQIAALKFGELVKKEKKT